MKKHKWFAVNEDLQHAIEDYMKERKTWKRNEPLLKSQKGTKSITRQHAWYILNKAAKEVGLEGLAHIHFEKLGVIVHTNQVLILHFYNTSLITVLHQKLLKYIGIA